MDDPILNIRIDSLTASLKKVQNLIGWVATRQSCLQDVDKLLREAGEAVARYSKAIDEYIHPLIWQAGIEGTVSPELERAQAAIQGLSQLAMNARMARQKIGSLSRICMRIGERRAALQIEKDFQEKAGETLAALSALQTGGPRAWADYEEHVRQPAERLFAEFSEFLAGLALRDSGLEADFCEMADDLLQSFILSVSTSTDFLTIPIPRELVVKLQNMIRLSYPEWTVWSLPMAAHEFWHAFASLHEGILKEFKKAAPDLSADDSELCLADAFGAYSMGPAYAYYAFLLSLNPVRAFAETADGPAAAKRAESILLMLDHMNSRQVAGPWTGLIAGLRDQWNAAIASASPDGPPLSPETRQKLSSGVRALAQALDRQTAAAFGLENWGHILEWSQSLLQGRIADIAVDASYDMRYVVNAAWLARQTVSGADRAAELGDAASLLRKRIADAKAHANGAPARPALAASYRG